MLSGKFMIKRRAVGVVPAAFCCRQIFM